MILKDKKKLDISYVPEKIPCREKEKKRLLLLLESGRAVISGDVGTGKTLLAKHAGGDVYVNCYTNKSEHKVLEEILRQIRPTFSTAGLASQRLWQEIKGDHLIILDEIEGMFTDDLRHFAYTLSRQPEIRERIRYVAVTRSSFVLEQIINDPATWSTFAEKAIVTLKPYTWEQIMEILEYRASESLKTGSYDDALPLIAEIALHSAGHMRSGIDILRNSAIIADKKGHEKILVEDVREANQESWIEEIDNLDKEQMLLLLAVAVSCKTKAYANWGEILDNYALKCEEYEMECNEKKGKKNLDMLINQGLVYESERGYTILDYPAELLIEEVENFLNK